MDLIELSWQPQVEHNIYHVRIGERRSGKTHWLAGHIIPGRTIAIVPHPMRDEEWWSMRGAYATDRFDPEDLEENDYMVILFDEPDAFTYTRFASMLYRASRAELEIYAAGTPGNRYKDHSNIKFVDGLFAKGLI